jgi:hypothetical protein
MPPTVGPEKSVTGASPAQQRFALARILETRL